MKQHETFTLERAKVWFDGGRDEWQPGGGGSEEAKKNIQYLFSDVCTYAHFLSSSLLFLPFSSIFVPEGRPSSHPPRDALSSLLTSHIAHQSPTPWVVSKPSLFMLAILCVLRQTRNIMFSAARNLTSFACRAGINHARVAPNLRR